MKQRANKYKSRNEETRERISISQGMKKLENE